MKSRDGKSQRREEERRSKTERVRRKKIQVREKVGKSRYAVFPMICGSGGSKSHVVRWVVRSTFPSQNAQSTPTADHFWKLRCRRVHAVVARSTLRSQNLQGTPCSEHFWKLRCRKSARPCGAKHMSKSKCKTHHMLGPLLDVQMSFRLAGTGDCAPCQKWAKRDGFVYKDDGRRGTFEEDLQRCIFRGRRSTRDMFIRAVRRSGRWFPEKGCILEHQIFRFAKMILRDRCST